MLKNLVPQNEDNIETGKTNLQRHEQLFSDLDNDNDVSDEENDDDDKGGSAPILA
jgi:hypothetical protein